MPSMCYKFHVFFFYKNKDSGLIFDYKLTYLKKKVFIMKKHNLILFVLSITLLNSCGSAKSTLKNIDNTAIKPVVRERQFVLTEYATDTKYGYNKDYPINLGFENETNSPKNITYFFNALTGENGEKISYKKIDSCCPFPSKKSVMGAGTLDIYEVTFEDSDKKKILYINIFEKGKVLCPKGFLIKKIKIN